MKIYITYASNGKKSCLSIFDHIDKLLYDETTGFIHVSGSLEGFEKELDIEPGQIISLIVTIEANEKYVPILKDLCILKSQFDHLNIEVVKEIITKKRMSLFDYLQNRQDNIE